MYFVNGKMFFESVWISKSFETRGITDSKLILSNNYLEMMTYNGDETSKYIIRYGSSIDEFKSDCRNSF